MDIDMIAPKISKYITKEEVQPPVVLTIKYVAAEDVAKGEVKAILYFQERPKGLVLNAGKKLLLKETFGKEADNYTGKKVRLSFDPDVMMGTQRVGGIKLECSKGKAVKAAPVAAPVEIVEDGTDLPF